MAWLARSVSAWGVGRPIPERFLKMASVTSWLPPALAGVTFTLLGSIKLYGYIRGIEGGAGRPALKRLCGT